MLIGCTNPAVDGGGRLSSPLHTEAASSGRPRQRPGPIRKHGELLMFGCSLIAERGCVKGGYELAKCSQCTQLFHVEAGTPHAASCRELQRCPAGFLLLGHLLSEQHK